MNVGHFNLHERRVGSSHDGWTIEGQPLVAFHFTLVDWDQRGFWPPVSRPLVREQPLLQELITQHFKLLEAGGWSITRKWPGGYDCFGNGLKISPATRREFRLATKAKGYQGDPFADPDLVALERRMRRKAAWTSALAFFPRLWKRLGRQFGGHRRRGS